MTMDYRRRIVSSPSSGAFAAPIQFSTTPPLSLPGTAVHVGSAVSTRRNPNNNNNLLGKRRRSNFVLQFDPIRSASNRNRTTTTTTTVRCTAIPPPVSTVSEGENGDGSSSEPNPPMSGLNGTGPLYGALLGAQLIPFVFPHSGLVGDISYFTITAVCALVLGCVRAQLEEGYGDDAQILTGKSAIAAPFVASGMLFGLFALLKYTHIDVALVINALTCLSAAFCLKETLDPVTEALLEKLGLQEPAVKTSSGNSNSSNSSASTTNISISAALKGKDDDDDVKIELKGSDWLSAGVSALVTLGYLGTHSYVLSNFLSLGIVCRILSLVKLESFAAASALLLGLVLYDVYWVFGSERVFSENVMVAVATLETPGKLLFPREVIDGMSSAQFKYAILGLGDLFVPGLFVTVLGSISKMTGGPYFKVGIASYTLGLLTCFVANTLSAAPQPALLYIVPALLAGAVTTAAVRGELQQVVGYKVEGTDDKLATATPSAAETTTTSTQLDNPIGSGSEDKKGE